jgi:hypothetical protein
MKEKTKKELMAIGKIALGGARIASGIATAAGKGLLGAYCKNHHLKQAGMMMARSSVHGGMKMIGDGMKELKQ